MLRILLASLAFLSPSLALAQEEQPVIDLTAVALFGMRDGAVSGSEATPAPISKMGLGSYTADDARGTRIDVQFQEVEPCVVEVTFAVNGTHAGLLRTDLTLLEGISYSDPQDSGVVDSYSLTLAGPPELSQAQQPGSEMSPASLTTRLFTSLDLETLQAAASALQKRCNPEISESTFPVDPAASEFDDLSRDLVLVAAEPAGPLEAFTFAAPNREVGIQDTLWPANTDLANAMYYGSGLAETGVDFRLANAVFETGQSPDRIIVIHGSADFAANAEAALTPKQFTAARNGDFLVLSHGEDYKIDFTSRTRGDPFTGAMSRSYRLAVSGDTLVVAYADAIINGALSALSDPANCAGCGSWRAMLDTIQAAAGDAATLEGATGFNAEALTSSPSSDTSSAKPAAVPSFTNVMFAATRNRGTGGKAHVAVLFKNREEATVGAEFATEALKELFAEASQGEPPAINTELRDEADGVVVTLTASFVTAQEAVHSYMGWLRAIYGGEFAPLAITR